MFKGDFKLTKFVTSLWACLMLAPAGFANADAAKKTYIFHLIDQNYDDFQTMIAGNDPFDFDNWHKLDLDRQKLEALIFMVAPVLGGCECEITYEPYLEETPHARSIELVRTGLELSHPISVFSDDSRVQDGVYLSETILDPDKFFVGLYTHSDRAEVLGAKSAKEIAEMRFVAGHDWEIDNKIIDNMGVPHLYADTWNNLLSMLEIGRADVVMQPFQATDDLGFVDSESGEKFMPIPDVKMPFNQGRRYFVSKVHPDGEMFLESLNQGIALLEQKDNILYRAHEWAGVINPETEDYAIVKIQKKER